jgi:hypothetical protein
MRWALRLRVEIASHHAGPDVATAVVHYGAALTLASELEMRPLVAGLWWDLVTSAAFSYVSRGRCAQMSRQSMGANPVGAVGTPQDRRLRGLR